MNQKSQMNDEIPLAKLASTKLVSVRGEGMPQCPQCKGIAVDRDLFLETEKSLNDIYWCKDCEIYFELVTPKTVTQKQILEK